MKTNNLVNAYDHKSGFSDLKAKPVKGFSVGSKRMGNTGVGSADINNWAPHGNNYYATNFSGKMGKTASATINDHKNAVC